MRCNAVGLQGESTGVGLRARMNEVRQTAGRVERDAEMAREWRTERRRARIRVDLTSV
jgi:hypothetical protein